MTNTYVIGDSIDAGDSFCGGGGASVQRVAWGHIRELEPAHPWTAAVWRRLLNHIRDLLEA